MKRILVAVTACGMAVAACGSSSGTSTMLSSSWTPPSALQYVPADTPYFIVALDDTSEQLDDLMFGEVAPGAGDLLKMFPNVPDKPIPRLGWQMVKELVGKTRAGWWSELGFKPHGHYLIYGLGLWPVMRVELADPGRTRVVMERVMAGAGRAASFGGTAGWLVEQDKIALAVAVSDGELIATLAPSAQIQAVAQRAISEHPARSLSAGQVRDIANRHHVATASLMVVDTRQVVTALTSLGGPDGISADCERDADRLASLTPRYVIGYTKVSASGIAGRVAIELAPALAAGLDKLHVAMPPLEPRASTPLMTMQVAVDLDAAVGWLRTAMTLLAAQPFTCSGMRDLNDTAASARDKLGEPLPEVIRGLHGVQMVVDDATITPPSGTGYALIAGADIAGLLQKLGPIPGIGPMLPGGGKPIALPTQSLGAPNLQAFFGASMDRAVVAIGADSSSRVSHELAATARDRAPLMTFSADLRELARRMPETARAGLSKFQSFRQESMVVDVADDSVVFDFELLK